MMPAVVAGVRDTPRGREAVERAAHRARREGATLHLVVAYDLQDTWSHRADRTVCPHDVAHLLSPRTDAELLGREAAEAVAGLGIEVCVHVRQSRLGRAVRDVARGLDLVAEPATTRVPAPAPAAAGLRRAFVPAAWRS